MIVYNTVDWLYRKNKRPWIWINLRWGRQWSNLNGCFLSLVLFIWSFPSIECSFNIHEVEILIPGKNTDVHLTILAVCFWFQIQNRPVYCRFRFIQMPFSQVSNLSKMLICRLQNRSFPKYRWTKHKPEFCACHCEQETKYYVSCYTALKVLFYSNFRRKWE